MFSKTVRCPCNNHPSLCEFFLVTRFIKAINIEKANSKIFLELAFLVLLL